MVTFKKEISYWDNRNPFDKGRFEELSRLLNEIIELNETYEITTGEGYVLLRDRESGEQAYLKDGKNEIVMDIGYIELYLKQFKL